MRIDLGTISLVSTGASAKKNKALGEEEVRNLLERGRLKGDWVAGSHDGLEKTHARQGKDRRLSSLTSFNAELQVSQGETAKIELHRDLKQSVSFTLRHGGKESSLKLLDSKLSGDSFLVNPTDRIPPLLQEIVKAIQTYFPVS